MPTISDRPAALRGTIDLPHIDPVMPSPCPEAFDDPEWLFEPRYDGLRGLLYNSARACEIRLAGEILFERCDELRDRVAGVLAGREAVLDGMVVALNHRGKPVLKELLRGTGYLAFAAFDLLWLDGRDLRDLTLAARKRLLSELLPEDTGPLYKVLTLEEHGRALFSAIQKMDLAGIVAKRKNESYRSTTAWYRIENPRYSEPASSMFGRERRRRSEA
jgi:bifunctional non-homologous end joining protein LigD